jgi:DNA ligase (NAD+)
MLKNWNFNVVNRRVIPSESLTSSSLEYELQSMCIHCGEYIDCDGFVGEDEQGLFAIKWNTESAISTVVGVKYNLSRLGKLSPVVQIEEVQLQDANITNVSGFNAKYIVDNGIGIGAVAKIVRSGDIIPAIIEVISRVTPDIPSVCPECNSPLINDGVDLVCANPNCTGTRLKQLINFVNIVSPVDGLGNSTKIKFFEFFGDNSIEDFINNLVTTYKYDIDYYLNNFRDEVDGIGSTSIVLIKEMLEKLLEPIQANKFLCGLGLKGLGLTYCNKLFSEMTFERFLNTLYNSADISDIACINITGRKSLIENSGFILELSGNLNIVDPIREENIKSSEELKICVTGKLSMTRKEFIDIASKECNAVEVPINKASILITDDKDSNSSKSKIARERGILMLSEEEFKCKYFNK